jgi:large subunit ribosomal protein L20
MPRVKRGVTTKAKHKRLLAKTKGMRAGRKNQIKLARQAFLKSGTNAYIDRRRKKRDFRASWIISINAACREEGINYSQFIKRLTDKKIDLNRKMLAEMAKKYPKEFRLFAKEVIK